MDYTIITCCNSYLCPLSCICLVEYLSKEEQDKKLKDPNYKMTIMIGTGSLISFQYPDNENRTLFMTSFHVVKFTSPSQVTGLKLIFQDRTIGNVNLTPDWVKTLWTSPEEELDIFIIEFGPIAMKVLSRTKMASLYPAPPKENDLIQLYWYPNLESGLQVNNGNITVINGQIINYKVTTEEGASGSPLLNRNFKVVGIHSGVWVTEKEENGIKIKYLGERQAVHINVILEAFTQELRNCMVGRI